MKIDVYLVGVLAAVHKAVRGVRGGRWDVARHHLASEGRYLARCVRERRWRALRQSFNGYLAEPDPWPEGLTLCGRGWTRRTALRSLRRLRRRMRKAGIR
ncbi:hypothetical protein J0910_00470 [Nocardiopsis sp. CNT-189]|uniref:hypothetical protein n=1 Tax=Nocardiopsis oceanisediminis TaxID=2816862 RepID=UPI003B2A6EDC